MKSSVVCGREVESRAADWVVRELGARILVRNYRIRGGEIDLVCQRGSELIFIEVRARLNPDWPGGVESVGSEKRRKLARTIRHWLQFYRGDARSMRIDILDWDGRNWTHFRNIQLED